MYIKLKDRFRTLGRDNLDTFGEVYTFGERKISVAEFIFSTYVEIIYILLHKYEPTIMRSCIVMTHKLFLSVYDANECIYFQHYLYTPTLYFTCYVAERTLYVLRCT